MRTTKEMITRGEGNFLHCTDYEDAKDAMIQYAKEAISEVQKMYWENLNNSVRNISEVKGLDEIALEVMKKLT